MSIALFLHVRPSFPSRLPRQALHLAQFSDAQPALYLSALPASRPHIRALVPRTALISSVSCSSGGVTRDVPAAESASGEFWLVRIWHARTAIRASIGAACRIRMVAQGWTSAKTSAARYRSIHSIQTRIRSTQTLLQTNQKTRQNLRQQHQLVAGTLRRKARL